MTDSFLHGVEVVEVDSGSRTITTVSTSIIGVVGTAPNADASVFPLNTPVLIAGSRTKAAKLDTVGTGEGTLPAAMDAIFDQTGAVVIVVRVEEGTDDETRVNIRGKVDATGKYLGAYAFLVAESVTAYRPRILIAPGFTGERKYNEAGGTYTANAVVSELVGIAERLRAVIIADGPNTTDDEAKLYAKDFDSGRIYVVDPACLIENDAGAIVTDNSSARVAGLIAKTDNEKGWWWSPSNQPINGIVGTARSVDFVLGDTSSSANLLNQNNVATIVYQNGYRLWGNRTLSSDSKYQFLCVRRTADIIQDSLLAAHLWAVDRGITRNYVKEVVAGVNAYLRSLVTKGAILGGSCWCDSDTNSAADIADGKIVFDFDFTPVYPAEHVTFQSRLVNDYVQEIFT